MNVRTVVRLTAAARIAIGVALALGTRPLLKAILRNEQPSGAYVLFARTVGIRDALFGLGALRAILDDAASSETRRWVRLWLANEIADVVAAVAAARELGVTGGAAAATPPLSFAAVDAWVLRQLGRSTSPVAPA